MNEGLSYIDREQLNNAVGGAGARAKIGDKLDNALSGRAVTFAVAAEASHLVATTLQVNDAQGNAIPLVTDVEWWVSDTAGGVVSTTVPTSATAVTLGKALAEFTSNLYGKVLTNAAGAVTIKVTQTAATNYYLNALIDGNVYSQAIVFAG